MWTKAPKAKDAFGRLRGASGQKKTLNGKYKQTAKDSELAPTHTKKKKKKENLRDGKVGEDVKVVTCSGRPGWQWWV